MNVERPERSRSRVWKAFAKRWPKHRFLTQDPLYALPEAFVRYLNCEGRDLFRYDDLQFEYDLSQIVAHGFFLKRPIGAVWRSQPHQKIEIAIEEIHFDPKQRQEPLPKDPTSWRWEREDENSTGEIFRSQQDEYCGWLIQQKEFWDDLNTARTECGAEIVARGGMPVPNPNSDIFTPDGLEYDVYNTPNGPEKEVYWVRWLCRKWCLSGLQTWELFFPRQPQLATAEIQPLGLDQGITVSIPYPFLAGRKFDVYEHIRQLRFDHTPRHLRDWVRIEDRITAGSTKGSFQKMFQLYRLLVLGLMRRYPDELSRKTVRLTQLLANYTADPKVAAKAANQGGVSVEQTRQQRIELLKILRDIAPDLLRQKA